MSSFIEEQIKFSNIIKEIGLIDIENSITINDLFKIDGISLWEAASAEMAWRHLTNIAEAKNFLQKLKVRFRPKFYKIKLMKDLIKNSFDRNVLKTKPYSDYILSLGFSPQMYNDVVQPVVRNLLNQTNLEIVIISLKNNKAIINNDNAQLVYFGKNDIKNFIKQKKAYFKHFRKIEETIKNSKSYNTVISKYKKNFGSDILSELMELFFQGLAPTCIVNLIYAKHYIKIFSPKCIISPDVADSRCRIFALMAKNLGIPVYEIQFGLTGPEGIEWRFFNSDRVAVWGQQAKKNLIYHGVPASKIIVTGSARHDMIFHNVKKLSSKQNGQVEEKKVKVLFASTYIDQAHGKYCSPEIILEMKKAVIVGALKNNNISLTIKAHPKENELNLRKYVFSFNKNILIASKNEDIRELILNCDAFISFGSTASLDSLLAKKPTASLSFPGWNFSDELLSQTPITILNSFKSVKSFLNSVSSGQRMNYSSKELKQIENVCLLKGNASERISSDILNLIKPKN